MATEVNNQATVNYTFGGSTRTITETSNVNVVSVQPLNEISLNKYTQDNTFTPGGTVTFFIDIKNTGSQYFTGVRIIDTLPQYLTYISGTAILYYNGQAIAAQVSSTSPLTFTLSPLPGGNQMILSYSCRVSNTIPSSISTLTNNVEGIGYAAMGETRDTASATITRSTSANLLITKESNKSSVAINENYSYIITLANSGLSEANVTTVSDQLPENFQISSITLKVGSSVTQLNPSDYSLDSNNMLTIPSSTGPEINVPASGSGGDGIAIITINVSLSA